MKELEADAMARMTSERTPGQLTDREELQMQIIDAQRVTKGLPEVPLPQHRGRATLSKTVHLQDHRRADLCRRSQL